MLGSRKRILVALLLLTCVSSCMGVRRNPPFEDLAMQQQGGGRPAQAAAPSPLPPVNFRGATDSTSWATPADNGQYASDRPDPQALRAAGIDPAMTLPPPRTSLARGTSPYAQAANPGPAAPPIKEPNAQAASQLTAFANGSGSGYGVVPPPPPEPVRPAQATAAVDRPAPVAAPTPMEKQPERVAQVGYTSQGDGAARQVNTAPAEVRSFASTPLPVIVNKAPTPPPLPLDLDQGVAASASPIIRIVNSKRISFSYELRDTGTAGSNTIELWSTRDMKIWKKCEVSRPAPNTYSLEVKDDGLYGFTLVARNNLASGSTGPRVGDMPQVWVTVDTIRPLVQLQGVDLNLTAKSPTLVIRWNAHDRNFNRKPVTISYAEQAEGPWVALASGVENTGRYEMAPTVSLPHRFFVRVEAVDTAGNAGTSQTNSAIRLELPLQQTGATAVQPVSADAPRLLPAPPMLDAVRPAVSIVNVEAN